MELWSDWRSELPFPSKAYVGWQASQYDEARASPALTEMGLQYYNGPCPPGRGDEKDSSSSATSTSYSGWFPPKGQRRRSSLARFNPGSSIGSDYSELDRVFLSAQKEVDAHRQLNKQVRRKQSQCIPDPLKRGALSSMVLFSID